MIKQLWQDALGELRKTQTQLYLTSFIVGAAGLSLGFLGQTSIAIPLLIGCIATSIAGCLTPFIR